MPSPISTPSRTRGGILFLTTIALCLVFLLLSLHLQDRERPHSLDSSPPLRVLGADEQCRLVHKAKDQCAFVHAHCPTDEGGFSLYLDWFYCSKLSLVKPIGFTLLSLWLALLFASIGVAASEFFCINLGAIADMMGLGENLTGVTLLAFGNGSPDVFSTFAAMATDSGSLAVGELFGAAGFIAAVVAGSMALIRPFHVARKSFVRDVGFFTVAAAFSIVFLLDGKLRIWETIAMTVFYFAYVAFCVLWHIWLGRKRHAREREAAARGHFVTADDTTLENEQYTDDPDQSTDSRRPNTSRGVPQEDWSALERGGGAALEDGQYEDEEEEARDRWMSDLASNMRLTKPTTRARRNTATPIRPSFMGALEFQAVYKSLKKSGNLQTIPMNTRHYSDDPSVTTLHQQEQMSTASDPAARPVLRIPAIDEPISLLDGDHNLQTSRTDIVGRGRAVSANDAASLQLSPQPQSLTPVLSQENLVDIISGEGTEHRGRPSLEVPITPPGPRPIFPAVQVEPATPRRDAPIQEGRSRAATVSGHLLAPPDVASLNRPSSEHRAPSTALSRRSTASLENSPSLVPRARGLPKIVIPTASLSPGSSRSTSPFPAYRDNPSPSLTGSTRSPISTRPPSLYLPASIASPESLPIDHAAEREVPRRRTNLDRWWPYRLLPPPENIVQTLFPVFYHWHEKSWYERLLNLCVAPSVFLFAVTLPVIDKEDIPEPVTPAKNMSIDSSRSRSSEGAVDKTAATVSAMVTERSPLIADHHEHNMATEGMTGSGNMATAAMVADQRRGNSNATPVVQVEGQPILEQQQPELWNRWLAIIQLYTAPLLIIFSIWLQLPFDADGTWLIKPFLIGLLASTVLLVPFLYTTTPTHRPGVYRKLFGAVGFFVSIGWISLIAAQVVDALKALAVILNMSHALMGLTIFAVGNSLGDLVANVTVAKLGYPVMAFSACFAGPMMNILLGIGLSGTYALVKGEERRRQKHPEKGIRFKSYHIDVSKTLIVSGITLVITLVGLLIAVPLNRWVMDRKIGFGLIILWTVSTIFNVVVEVTDVLDSAEQLWR